MSQYEIGITFSKIIVPWTPENVLMRGLTKYKFLWGSFHCSMKTGVELIYRSINSVHNHILPGHVKVSYKVVFWGGWGVGVGYADLNYTFFFF